jgi:hypothetical protein
MPVHKHVPPYGLPAGGSPSLNGENMQVLTLPVISGSCLAVGRSLALPL